MDAYYITFRSVTHAQRGERVLKDAGLKCSLRRTPRWMEEQGCGYCIGLRGEVSRARELLEANEVPLRRIYRKGKDGRMEPWES